MMTALLPAHSAPGSPVPPPPDDAPSSAKNSHAKKRVLGGAAVALLIAGGAYALSTGAAFTDRHVVDGNTVGTASLTIGDTVEFPLSADNLVPSEEFSYQYELLTFENTGTVPFAYRVSVENVATSDGSPDALESWIPVSVRAGGDDGVAFDGTLADPPVLPPTQADPLVLQPGEQGVIDARVGLSPDADNTAQGRTATFDVVVTAEQID